jgi:hypothetical protein
MFRRQISASDVRSSYRELELRRDLTRTKNGFEYNIISHANPREENDNKNAANASYSDETIMIRSMGG